MCIRDRAYPDYDLKRLYEKFSTMSKDGQSLKDRIALLTRSSAELTDVYKRQVHDKEHHQGREFYLRDDMRRPLPLL